MNRLNLVKQVMSYKDVISNIEPDTLNICQSHFKEFNTLWDEMRGFNKIRIEQMINEGPWSDSELKELIEQVEVIMLIMNNK